VNLALWKERFREYMQLCGWSPRTVATYIYELGPLFSFLEAHGVDSVAAITQEVVEEYRTHLFYAEYRGNDPTLKGQRLSIRTQGTRLSAVKAFLRFLVCEHFLLVDVGAGVELPRTPRPLPRVLLSEREVERLMMAPDTSTPLGLRNRAILEVLYGTAIRNSELRYLTLDEVDVERRELRIQRGKGSKSRVVPLGKKRWCGLKRIWWRQGRNWCARLRSGWCFSPTAAWLLGETRCLSWCGRRHVPRASKST